MKLFMTSLSLLKSYYALLSYLRLIYTCLANLVRYIIAASIWDLIPFNSILSIRTKSFYHYYASTWVIRRHKLIINIVLNIGWDCLKVFYKDIDYVCERFTTLNFVFYSFISGIVAKGILFRKPIWRLVF